MRRPFAQGAVIAVVFLFVGIATAAGVLAFIPNPGSPPAIFDDFSFSSTSNGYWHVNPVGATATITHSRLTLSGHSIELDHRLQTDPVRTIVIAKVRALRFNKFAMGLGIYHSGTIGIEFDADGIKCARGTEVGEKIDFVKAWTAQNAPVGKWYYLEISVTNPYSYQSPVSGQLKKPIQLVCSAYDMSGRPLATDHPVFPPANAHYAALDEMFMRTWDSGNAYQVDWVYAGPPSGNPVQGILK